MCRFEKVFKVKNESTNVRIHFHTVKKKRPKLIDKSSGKLGVISKLPMEVNRIKV